MLLSELELIIDVVCSSQRHSSVELLPNEEENFWIKVSWLEQVLESLLDCIEVSDELDSTNKLELLEFDELCGIEELLDAATVMTKLFKQLLDIDDDPL